MEQRDLIKDQIEQLGKVLGKILADFLGLKSDGRIAQGVETIQTQLDLKLDINIDELMNLSKDELKNYLSNRKIAISHYETLGESLKEIGEHYMSNDINKAKNYLNKSIELLDLEDEMSRTVSFERLRLKAKIEDKLSECEKTEKS